MKRSLSFILSSLFGASIALLIFNFRDYNERIIPEGEVVPAPVTYTRAAYAAETTDFTEAAETTVHAVVHVKNTAVKSYRDPFSAFIFGGGGSREYEQVGTGSGVIISSDGYIVTNNHVISGASEIEITLNDKRTYMAELIGADANSDIALLKIEEQGLKYLSFGDSDAIKIGEWVLAVGNPYNLTSTVTAGIISAKGRDLQGNFSTDSFIQTDAAVNPGNSGGALVNTNGELIGINTAISSQTGGFVGYSFAVPSNITQKIIEDFIEFGSVQKVILGIRPVADREDKINGVQIAEVTDQGNAKSAGLESGDVITSMDGVRIQNFSNLKGFLNAKRPGDKISVQVTRQGNSIEKQVVLAKDNTVVLRQLGLVVEDLDSKRAKRFGVEGGAEIKDMSNEYLESYGVQVGFIITKVNNVVIKNAFDLEGALKNRSRREPLFIEMIDKEGELQKLIFN
ncbi:MAG: trypsin-like peptidase domain-containing protein [Flavobacteriaceae bacterium]